MKNKIKISWKKKYIDNYETEDLILYINREETEYTISKNGDWYYCYIYNRKVYATLSLNEAKKIIIRKVKSKEEIETIKELILEIKTKILEIDEKEIEEQWHNKYQLSVELLCSAVSNLRK